MNDFEIKPNHRILVRQSYIVLYIKEKITYKFVKFTVSKDDRINGKENNINKLGKYLNL